MGRNYVMSDIHGMSGLLKKMLDIIQPGADDRVYILGDMIDRYPYYYNTYNVLCADERLIWDMSMIDRQRGIPGYVSVVGHVPTILVRGVAGRPAEIWKSPDGCLIDVDCGAVFPSAGGRLGCLCMETRQEYYVSARVCGSP